MAEDDNSDPLYGVPYDHPRFVRRIADEIADGRSRVKRFLVDRGCQVGSATLEFLTETYLREIGRAPTDDNTSAPTQASVPPSSPNQKTPLLKIYSDILQHTKNMGGGSTMRNVGALWTDLGKCIVTLSTVRKLIIGSEHMAEVPQPAHGTGELKKIWPQESLPDPCKALQAYQPDSFKDNVDLSLIHLMVKRYQKVLAAGASLHAGPRENDCSCLSAVSSEGPIVRSLKPRQCENGCGRKRVLDRCAKVLELAVQVFLLLKCNSVNGWVELMEFDPRDHSLSPSKILSSPFLVRNILFSFPELIWSVEKPFKAYPEFIKQAFVRLLAEGDGVTQAKYAASLLQTDFESPYSDETRCTRETTLRFDMMQIKRAIEARQRDDLSSVVAASENISADVGNPAA